MPSRGRILLADDEATFLQATADLLRREGYECETASDGEDAFARLEAESFDLLISDVEMPGNRDLALLRRAARASLGLPIIVITGIPTVESAITSIDLSVVRYLLKPVELEDLLDCVDEAMSRWQRRQEVFAAERSLEGWIRRWGRASADPAVALEEARTSVARALGHLRSALAQTPPDPRCGLGPHAVGPESRPATGHQ